MNRQHPCPHFAYAIILILVVFSEIWIRCHYLLTDPRTMRIQRTAKMVVTVEVVMGR